MRRVVLEQLSGHLLAKHIYEPMESAYRHGHITEAALLKVQNEIPQKLNKCEMF